jgi:hypothetical protein
MSSAKSLIRGIRAVALMGKNTKGLKKYDQKIQTGVGTWSLALKYHQNDHDDWDHV